jgi:hypothetical protein
MARQSKKALKQRAKNVQRPQQIQADARPNNGTALPKPSLQTSGKVGWSESNVRELEKARRIASADKRDGRKLNQNSEVDHIDRTKNYGFPAREGGRYGSHPLHDGFDDESGPE